MLIKSRDSGLAGLPAAVARSLADAKPASFWLDSPQAPGPLPTLTGSTAADLVVVGGGFTGLWTALLAKEREQRYFTMVIIRGICPGRYGQ